MGEWRAVPSLEVGWTAGSAASVINSVSCDP